MAGRNVVMILWRVGFSFHLECGHGPILVSNTAPARASSPLGSWNAVSWEYKQMAMARSGGDHDGAVTMMARSGGLDDVASSGTA